ncbi:hypothetical protein AB8U03_12245 [Clostridium sp. Mt-5]|uniref:Uncharacterized protein n=1 Tax=Clostridium moutaii TaxID=3240932 RepID=A0ABV4BQB5_9CLOT
MHLEDIKKVFDEELIESLKNVVQNLKEAKNSQEKFNMKKSKLNR